MKGIIDHYIIELDSLYEGSPIIGGVGADQFFDKQIALDDKDVLFNPNKYKRTWAKIIAVPQRLSQFSLDLGYNGIFKVGDIVHFFYTALADKYLIDKTQVGDKFTYQYLLPIENAICAVRNKEYVIVNDGNALLEPIVLQGGETITKGGIILQEEERIDKQRGIVLHSDTYNHGEEVLFVPNSDSKIVINGHDYLAMKDTDIFATIERGEMVLNDDLVLIEPIELGEKTESGIIVPEMARRNSYRGKIVKRGSVCEDLEIGQEIMYSQHIAVVEEDNKTYLVVKAEDIMLAISE